MMGLRWRSGVLPVLALFSAVPVFAGGITYTCDTSNDGGAIGAGTCNYLNTTIAGLYSNTFTDANAHIYIRYGATGLGGSNQNINFVSYSRYLTALAANSSGDPVDVAALAALNNIDTAVYGSDEVVLTSALGAALGFSGLGGITPSGGNCDLGRDPNCYNGVITITGNSNILYYRNGTETSGQYDFYSTVEHETDEILGTPSCINTQTDPLSDACGSGIPSAVDLFRYNAGNLVPVSDLDTTYGAYFSYNGGVTNGADGALYNAADNGDDYGDFISGCPSTVFVQDGVGCPGGDAGLDITNDGPGGTAGPEITILDTVGFNLATPEPGTMGMLGFGLFALCMITRRRRRNRL